MNFYPDINPLKTLLWYYRFLLPLSCFLCDCPSVRASVMDTSTRKIFPSLQQPSLRSTFGSLHIRCWGQLDGPLKLICWSPEASAIKVQSELVNSIEVDLCIWILLKTGVPAVNPEPLLEWSIVLIQCSITLKVINLIYSIFSYPLLLSLRFVLIQWAFFCIPYDSVVLIFLRLGFHIRLHIFPMHDHCPETLSCNGPQLYVSSDRQ
jgi:hypothetical protein